METEKYGEGIVLRVRKGIQVEIEEVDEFTDSTDSDERVRGDRDVQIAFPVDLKVAVKRVERGDAGFRANVVTMCG